jgi:hypothetical protein
VPVLRKSVPEVSVDEHGDLCGAKDDAGTSPLVAEWPNVHAVSKTSPAEEPPNGEL